MSRFELLFCQRLKKKRFTLFRFTACQKIGAWRFPRGPDFLAQTCTPCSMAVIPVASKAGGPRDKLLTNTATGVLAAIRDHYLARMSALGHFQTLRFASPMSALRSKADILQRDFYFCLVPQADMRSTDRLRRLVRAVARQQRNRTWRSQEAVCSPPAKDRPSGLPVMSSLTHCFRPPNPASAMGASVTFEPGARTAWHTRPLGQTLIVTSGLGRAQCWEGPIEEIRPGDFVWFPPGEKHWHGATPSTTMTHIAIQEALDGIVVDWMEHVSDEQYGVLLRRR